MYNFLFLSFLSGIMELGAVYIGIAQELPVILIMALPFFYQIGNLATNYMPRKRWMFIAMGNVVIVLSFFNVKSWCYPALAIQLMLCSSCIQMARDIYKKQCPAWLKRSFRIAGFAASPLTLVANAQLVILISICFAIISLMANSRDFSDFVRPKSDSHGISFVMVFHQIHYFVYTYIMPLFVFNITNNYCLSALAFAITWIVYLTPQTLAERFEKVEYKMMFFICHMFLAVCLGLMSLFASFHGTYIVLGVWLFTGLGGGSVFCIKYLSDRQKRINMDLSENIGHVLGPVIAMIICAAAPGKETIYLLFTSCICVLIAILFGVGTQFKEDKR